MLVSLDGFSPSGLRTGRYFVAELGGGDRCISQLCNPRDVIILIHVETRKEEAAHGDSGSEGKYSSMSLLSPQKWVRQESARHAHVSHQVPQPDMRLTLTVVDCVCCRSATRTNDSISGQPS